MKVIEKDKGETMREQFEKLPEIAKALNANGGGFYKELTNSYHHTNTYYDKFINGAWYAFQEQQKTIVKYEAGLRKNKANKHKLLAKNIELQKKIDAVLHCIAQSELHQDREIWGLQDEIKELLK